MKAPIFLLAPATAALLLSGPEAWAGTFLQSYSVAADIPDDSSNGLLNSQTVSITEPTITAVSVGLTIDPSPGQSAFLGDLYVYLEHNSKIAVLINRPGRTATELAGYDDNQSLSITLADGSPDIHTYRLSPSTPLTGSLTGTWGPDGRATDPRSVLATDNPTQLLGGFDGGDANGTWNLFVSDLSGGGAHRLASWTLNVTTAAVPEPQAWLAGCGLVAWAGWRAATSPRRRALARALGSHLRI